MKYSINFIQICLVSVILITLCSSVVQSNEIVPYNTIEERVGLMYKKGEKQPFTGIIKKYYSDGSVDSEIYVTNGKNDGSTKNYYKTGEIESEAYYKNGILDGPAKRYYKSGKVESEAYFKNGRKEGEARLYFENGGVKSKAYFEDDKIDFLKTLKKKE